MRRGTAISLMKPMRRSLGRCKLADAFDQFVPCAIVLEQRAQIDASIAKQAQMQFSKRRDAQAIATGTEILRIRRDYADPSFRVLMPELDGLGACREIRATSTVPIVFLSSKDEEVDRILGLELGADDYVVKPFSPRELVARVRANLRRVAADRDVKASLVQVGALQINNDTFEARWEGVLMQLTHTEFCILATLARQPDRVWTRDALMQGAYDGRRIVSDRTIDSHIRRLRDKLTAAGAPGIRTVHGVGYRLSAP